MKSTACFLLLLASALAVTASYTVVVAENGNALVTIALTGQGSVNVPLPIDSNPQVAGALYVPTTNGIDVTVGSSGAANVIYQTATIATQEEEGGPWVIEMDLVSPGQVSVTVSLPNTAAVASTFPTAQIADVGNSRNIIWSEASQSIKAEYSITEQPAAEDNWLLIGVIVVLLAVIALLGFFYKKKGVSEGQANVLKTLSENERKVMDLIIGANGLRRNILEKQSGLAKSSLASTLSQLQKKKLVSLNKQHTVHFVEPSDWFKSL